MTAPRQTTLTRRSLHKLALVLPAPLLAAVLANRSAGLILAQEATTATEPRLVPTPSCADADDLAATMQQTEGPYYTPETPERQSLLEPGMPGTPLRVTGYVYDTACQPIPGALLDFWQCDDAGIYDNEGYRLRGHQFSNADGLYQLETVLPGLYPGRTRHIHVKAQAPGQPVLTTQLYFPDEPSNAEDGIFDPSLVVDLQPGDERQEAYFTFVLEV